MAKKKSNGKKETKLEKESKKLQKEVEEFVKKEFNSLMKELDLPYKLEEFEKYFGDSLGVQHIKKVIYTKEGFKSLFLWMIKNTVRDYIYLLYEKVFPGQNVVSMTESEWLEEKYKKKLIKLISRGQSFIYLYPPKPYEQFDEETVRRIIKEGYELLGELHKEAQKLYEFLRIRWLEYSEEVEKE